MAIQPTLSVCMIARNEASHLAQCLESVRGLADEIVFVDTGSADGTPEIARSFGARLLHLAWQDDFSLARNYGIERATGDWILILDPDESIAARDHASIRDLLRRQDLHVVSVRQRNYVRSTLVGWRSGPGGYEEGIPYPGFVDVEQRRLFRRGWLRYRNRVHEHLVPTDPSRPLVDRRAAWVVHHYGKVVAPAHLRAKAEAYLRIGLQKAEDLPDDPVAHYELGVQYAELARPEAALRSFERAQSLCPAFRDTHLLMAICHLRLGQHQQALDALEHAAHAAPHLSAEIAFHEGNVRRAMCDEAAAERAFRRSATINPAFAAATVNLALVLEQQSRAADALACLDRAVEACPTHAELRSTRARIRRRTGDENGALHDLEQLGSDEAAVRMRARILARHRRFHEAHACLAGMAFTRDADVQALRGVVALGLGDLDTAVAALRCSLDLHATSEAAWNLSIALDGRGDRAGALAAAADALRLSPHEAHVLQRFYTLAGESLRPPAATDDSSALTLFFYEPAPTRPAVRRLAEAFADRAHRVVVFEVDGETGARGGVEYAPWNALASRCLADRPHVLLGVRSGRMAATTHVSRGVDLFALESDWRADACEARCRAALRAEPPVVERVAVHLEAGRARLAQRMLERDAPPEGTSTDLWNGLRTFVAWRAGDGEAPSSAMLEAIARHFPSIRRAAAR